ncbi:eef7672e-9e31-4a2c-967a-cde4ac3a9b7f [Sclerotinia trifoliorum]|uniref:Eef7672e-9e31-4a2c-967a-cde4ac3a9b7f n=1 Tax=Sclerotinia trifoliorum TaxID=28548 RepID=A0A8H2VS62_9HELO|nr:eef7672e-9e31-4a2c-967a-cde4ac3a9b7f [Sclerotinia trifoliorum]
MTTVRSIIQKLQAYNEDDIIEDLLDNSKFIQEITELIKLLPKARTVISKIILNSKLPRKKDADQILKLIRKVTNIELPSEVLEKYKECQQYPFKFWSWAGIQFDLTADKIEPIEFFFRRVYLGINQLETQRAWDTIIWRFLTLFFHDLVVILNRKILTESLENQLVDILCSVTAIQDTTIKIRENLRRWVAAGFRYSQLSDSLGYGAPFLLPLSITDNTWEKRLPIKGPIYESAIEHLESKCFREKSMNLGADTLGAEIREAILKPFRWNLSTFKQNTHSSLYRDLTVTGGSTGLREDSGAEAGPSTFRSNHNSIDTQLNLAEPIQSQQLSSIGNSSLQSTNEVVFNESEHNVIAGELSEIRSGRMKRGLGSQTEAYDLPSKRRRIDSLSNPDSSLPHLSSGITYNQHGGAMETPTSGNVNVNKGIFTAEFADMNKLESILGSYLLKGIDASHKRQKEGKRFTETVRLHLTLPKKDCRLEIWICSSVGKAISETAIESVEDWKNILGNYLFEGMNASNLRMGEVETGMLLHTRAIHISSSDSSDNCDYKVEVTLSFEKGNEIYKHVYPQ